MAKWFASCLSEGVQIGSVVQLFLLLSGHVCSPTTDGAPWMQVPKAEASFSTASCVRLWCHVNTTYKRWVVLCGSVLHSRRKKTFPIAPLGFSIASNCEARRPILNLPPSFRARCTLF